MTVWPESLPGWEAGAVKYRFQWTFPICVSPHDHNRVYVGSQFVHMTTNGGQSWEIISPDLSTNDKTKQQRTGGLTADEVLFMLGFFQLADGFSYRMFGGFNAMMISRRAARGQVDHMLIQPRPLWMQLMGEAFMPVSGSSGFLMGIAVTVLAGGK